MSASSRRGACPTLAAPMATGDGLLARLTPLSGGVTPAQLAGLAKAAGAYGNGQLEITGRGNLQIRGLSEATLPDLNRAVSALNLTAREGVPIDIAPLAGLDPQELADPRPLAQALASAIATQNLAEQLGPKVSVVIDGGGRSMLDAVKADIRLEADGGGKWRLSLAGDRHTAHPVGAFNQEQALTSTLDTLIAIAKRDPEARARDLIKGDDARPTREQGRKQEASILPFGETIPLRDGRSALRVAFAFGAIDAPTLASFAEGLVALGVSETRLCSERSLLLLCDSLSQAEQAFVLATTNGLIIQPDDARLAIVACAGAPACASAHFATRPLAQEIAANKALFLPAGLRLHLSGCAKRCAEPGGRSTTLIGAADGNHFAANGTAPPQALLHYFQKRGLIRPGIHQAS